MSQGTVSGPMSQGTVSGQMSQGTVSGQMSQGTVSGLLQASSHFCHGWRGAAAPHWANT
jgi:uncharacterized protein YwbE